ncbi:MAG: hypothetical protein E7774_15495 [Bradyrhizobium sp.]|nr:MAG: hypothetical protein E7774_15495 [Bradyrhizobium sp.]
MSIALLPAAAPPAGAAARPYEAAPLIVGLAVFALAAFSPAVLNDGDTWTHVATGQWILAHGAVPRIDPFSYTFAGQPWTAHEWLAEVLMAIAFRLAGWSGVALLTGAAAGAAVAIMARRAARDLSGPALLVVAALSALLIAPSLLARPHILALPLVALWGSALLSARERGEAPPIANAALMALWANLHGGFAFGLALIAPFALEALLAAPAEERLKSARDWSLFALASALAATVTPFGVEGLLFPIRLLGLSHLGEIGEWRPENFAHPGPMEVALLALIGFALLRPTSMPWLRAALLIGLIHMSLQHGRHQTLLAILAPMLIAPAIAKALSLGEPVKPRLSHETILAVAAAALALIGARIALPIARVDGPTAPISALRAAPQALRDAPVLNGYPFGGYLIASGVKPFIDGRADMYGDAFLDLYGKIAAGDRETIEATIARYGVSWTIFAPNDPANAAMDHEPGWRRLYADHFAVVHVRDDAGGAAELREGN